MTSVVVFDLGGVLCRFDAAARTDALAAASGWEANAVRGRIWGSGRDAAADRGELTETEAYALASLDGALDRDTIVECWRHAFTPDDDVLAIADTVRVARALLTNNGPVVEALFAGHLAAIAERCDPLMLSWRLGATKPSEEVLARAAERCARDPDAMLMVDDSERNVAGARAAGWDAIHFTEAPALARELAIRGLTSE